MILGFTGLAGSGKSTVSDYLVQTRPHTVKINMKDALVSETKLMFPDLLAEIAEANNMTVDELFTVKPYVPFVRNLLKNYGTEVVRSVDKNHWVNAWRLSVVGAVADGKDVVTDDIRFLNEAEALLQFDGKIIRIERLDINDTGTHTSETEMSQIKVDTNITVAQGEQKELCDLVDEWIKEYGK